MRTMWTAVVLSLAGLLVAGIGLTAQEGKGGKMDAGAESDGRFFREHWAENDGQQNNGSSRLLRVNDPDTSLQGNIGRRREANCNGLLLIDVPEDLFSLTAAELYLELWGGHPHTAGKSFAVNGRSRYLIPEVGTEAGACTYSYPSIELKVGDLVTGVNALQFACRRGPGFWGHFIVDNACVRAYLDPDHNDLKQAGLDGFRARVVAPQVLGDTADVSLECPGEVAEMVRSVDFFARYQGFDDDGNVQEDDWHGYTQERHAVNHVGSADAPPFTVSWDTRMVPTQGRPIAFRAVVHFRNGLHYETGSSAGSTFPRGRPRVELLRCSAMPQPFWSRAGAEKRAVIELPEDLSRVAAAELRVRVWDGGAGTVAEPFQLNGHPYSVLSGRASHDVVFTKCAVSLDHLKAGENEVKLLSDTEHHGIEVLLPGPCLLLRYRD